MRKHLVKTGKSSVAKISTANLKTIVLRTVIVSTSMIHSRINSEALIFGGWVSKRPFFSHKQRREGEQLNGHTFKAFRQFIIIFERHGFKGKHVHRLLDKIE